MARSHLSDGFWASVLQWSRLGANALVFLIVARFLTLEEIGAFATAAAPLRFFQVIHKSGIEESVILGPNGKGDHQALFLLSVAAALAVISVSGFAGVILGRLHDIGPMLAVLSLASLMFALGAVPDGILRREGKFRLLALRTLAAQAIAAIVTVTGLMAGLGPWSLVLFTLTNAALAAAISMASACWRPALRCPDRAAFSRALGSASILSARVLIGAALQPVLQIGVGAVAGLSAAGMFQIALRVLSLMEAVTLAPLRFLALPRFTSLRADKQALRESLLTALRVAGLVSAWVYLGVAAAAPDMLTLLVGSANAAGTAPILRVLCLSGLGAAGAAVINQALIGTEQGAVAFRLSLFLAVTTLAVASPLLSNVTNVAGAMVIAGLVAFAVMIRQMPLWFGISRTDALRAVAAPYAAGTIMALAVIAMNRWIWPGWPLPLRLAGQITAGSALYLGALRLAGWQGRLPTLRTMRA